MRLILDTNVLVSANIQRSYPFFIVDRVFADPNLQVCISDQLFAEYFEVLNREKFFKFADFQTGAQRLLTDIESYALNFSPTSKVTLIKDKPDNRLLELAEVCGADYLITGNTKDFTMSEYKGTKIVSPKASSKS